MNSKKGKKCLEILNSIAINVNKGATYITAIKAVVDAVKLLIEVLSK